MSRTFRKRGLRVLHLPDRISSTVSPSSLSAFSIASFTVITILLNFYLSYIYHIVYYTLFFFKSQGIFKKFSPRNFFHLAIKTAGLRLIFRGEQPFCLSFPIAFGLLFGYILSDVCPFSLPFPPLKKRVSRFFLSRKYYLLYFPYPASKNPLFPTTPLVILFTVFEHIS